MRKIIIYQTFPRLFGNQKLHPQANGSITDNGCGKMNDYNNAALRSIAKLGCNFIWYTGLIQHAQRTDYSTYGIPKGNPYVIKGEAGSPYAISDYYAIDPDLATDPLQRMEEFDALVSRTHANGLKMIIDFVPNHVARQYKSLLKPNTLADLGATDHIEYPFHPQNNFYYIPNQEFAPHIDLGCGACQYHEYPAKATGNDCFHAYPGSNDWYETIKLNYGIDYSTGYRCFEPTPDTWTKMLHILLYWSEKGIDGFRCDMAHMVPVEFWEWAIPLVKKQYPGVIFIAELYSPELYRDYLFRGHFDYLYDKVGLYDTLRATIGGHAPASAITACWQNLEGIQDKMLNFLENHDEQRIASDFFAGDARKAIPALIVSATMNTNPFMIYFGQELGERGMDAEGFSGKDGRTTIFDYWSIEKMIRWNNNGKWNNEKLTGEELALRKIYSTILCACNREKAICRGLFFDLMYANNLSDSFNPQKQYAYLRKHEEELIVCLVNFDDKDVECGIRIPEHAFEYLQIKPGSYEGFDLISGEIKDYHLTNQELFLSPVSAHSGRMIRFDLSKPNREKNKKTNI
ncbi:MAG: alpha-amylase family glycosyl hydrolase [Bacteroidales bacterium]